MDLVLVKVKKLIIAQSDSSQRLLTIVGDPKIPNRLEGRSILKADALQLAVELWNL